MPVQLHELNETPDRVAAVYRDAAQWSGMLTPEDEVATLAWVVDRAVFSVDEVRFESVIRIIEQVLSELGRVFYHTATEKTDDTARFYRKKLKLDDEEPAVHNWKVGEMWELRRDVDWL